MELIGGFIDFVLHLDTHLASILSTYGVWCYLLFFVIIFAETGLVVTPFLPGDSLLFALGTFAAAGSLNVASVFVILAAAAVLGDSANYTIGKYFGSFILKKEGAWFLKKEHIERTHRFYERYGSKTIVLARFVPIVRTFITVMAGVGRMPFASYAAWSVVGGVLWGTGVTLLGYWLGNVTFIKNNIDFIAVGIVLLSVIPIWFEMRRHRGQPAGQAEG